jgi:hypothetical protein
VRIGLYGAHALLLLEILREPFGNMGTVGDPSFAAR